MKDKRNCHGAVGKLSLKQHPPPLSILHKISRALHLAQPGLTAGRQAGRLAGWLAGRPVDEIEVNFENFEICYRLTYLTFCFI